MSNTQDAESAPFILDSIKYTFTTVKRLGCRFITVDALSSATSFYEKMDFSFLQRLTVTMRHD